MTDHADETFRMPLSPAVLVLLHAYDVNQLINR